MDPAKRTLLRVEIAEEKATAGAGRRLMGNKPEAALPLHPGARGVRQGPGHLRPVRAERPRIIQFPQVFTPKGRLRNLRLRRLPRSRNRGIAILRSSRH